MSGFAPTDQGDSSLPAIVNTRKRKQDHYRHDVELPPLTPPVSRHFSDLRAATYLVYKRKTLRGYLATIHPIPLRNDRGVWLSCLQQENDPIGRKRDPIARAPKPWPAHIIKEVKEAAWDKVKEYNEALFEWKVSIAAGKYCRLRVYEPGERHPGSMAGSWLRGQRESVEREWRSPLTGEPRVKRRRVV